MSTLLTDKEIEKVLQKGDGISITRDAVIARAQLRKVIAEIEAIWIEQLLAVDFCDAVHEWLEAVKKEIND